IPYDVHENDFASWSWTDLPAQRMRDAPLTPPFGLGPRLELGPVRAPLRRLVLQLPLVGDGLHAIKQRLERHWAARPSGKTREEQHRARQLERAIAAARAIPIVSSPLGTSASTTRAGRPAMDITRWGSSPSS